MKYKLKRTLPFMKAGEIFGLGTWVSGGFGVDMGKSSTGAHNGIRVFTKLENRFLMNYRLIAGHIHCEFCYLCLEI